MEKVKEVEGERGLELATVVTDGVETKGVTSAPRSSKQM